MSRSTRLHYLALGSLVGAAALFLVLGLSSGQQENQPPTKKPSAQTRYQPPVDPPRTTVRAPAKPSSGNHNGDGQEAKGGDAQEAGGLTRLWNAVLAWGEANIGGKDGWAQWVMAVFGTIATVVSIWAVILLHGTLKETRKATKAVSEAERAWMYCSGYTPHILITPVVDGVSCPRSIGVTIQWRNGGRSPAIGARIDTSHQVAEGEQGGDSIPWFEPEESTRQGNIGPGMQASTSMRTLSGSDYELWVKKKLRFFVYSRIDYETVGDTEPHHSTACGEFVCEGERTEQGVDVPVVTLQFKGSQNTVS